MNEDDRVELVKRLVTLSYRLSRRSKITLGAEAWAEHSADLRTAAALLALQGADTVTEAMIEAGSRVLCRAYQLDDGWDENQADRHAASEMGLNFRCEARDCYTAMRAAAPTAQDDTGARLDAVWDELQSLLPQSGVGAELQSAWDRLQSLLAARVQQQ